MNVISRNQVKGYLTELDQDEHLINEIATEFEALKTQLEVRLRRYMALRDFVAEQLGVSPYATVVEWPRSATTPVEDRGRFSFTGMKVGDAVRQALQDASVDAEDSNWLTLDEIIDRLTSGGLGFPERIETRAVNAALRRTSGIKQGTVPGSGEAVYRFEEEDERTQENPDLDPDDLPF